MRFYKNGTALRQQVLTQMYVGADRKLRCTQAVHWAVWTSSTELVCKTLLAQLATFPEVVATARFKPS
jgi:hypothetical protein